MPIRLALMRITCTLMLTGVSVVASGCFSTHLLDEMTIQRINKDPRHVSSINAIVIQELSHQHVHVVVRVRMEDDTLWDFSSGSQSVGPTNTAAAGPLIGESRPFAIFVGPPTEQVITPHFGEASFGGEWRPGGEFLEQDAVRATIVFRVSRGDGAVELFVFVAPPGGRPVGQDGKIHFVEPPGRLVLIPDRSPRGAWEAVADVTRAIAFFTLIIPTCALDVASAPIQIPLALLDVGGLGRWTAWW